MDTQPKLPIPISVIDGKYLLFDIDAVTWLRKHHQICGVFIGTLPQNPSQNVFLGLPMQIMSEEAQVLVESGIAYLLDDARAHDQALAKVNREKQQAYVVNVRQQSQEISEVKAREKEAERARILKQVQGKKTKSKRKDVVSSAPITTSPALPNPPTVGNDQEDTSESVSLFEPTMDVAESRNSSQTTIVQQQHPPRSEITITPTTSAILLDLLSSSSLPTSSTTLKPSPMSTRSNFDSSAYSIYRHLHTCHAQQELLAPISARYFATPGLRFGCQFCIYPGDPLRYHSYFLGVGIGWEEEIDLMDIVSGGRLGTAVKKGYLFGGMEPGGILAGQSGGNMRTFSVEWTGM